MLTLRRAVMGRKAKGKSKKAKDQSRRRVRFRTLYRSLTREDESLVILPARGFAANMSYLVNHPQSVARIVARRIESAAGDVIPADWNFTQAQISKLRQID